MNGEVRVYCLGSLSLNQRAIEVLTSIKVLYQVESNKVSFSEAFCYHKDMKSLFICRQNTGRSQVAMELFTLHFGTKAGSAGTAVDDAGQKLIDRLPAKNVITIMKDYGVDMSNNIRKQVTPEMADEYDKIFVMAEPATIPVWLSENKKTEIWIIPDMKDLDLESSRKVVAEIDEKIKHLTL